ncbi:Prefoldin subunit-like protein [Paramyrothecium foliicola]|nr:Prefoldin subunit-like protein [Paramyrothecium foliicola]
MAIPNEALQKLVREIETQAVAAQQQIGLARTQMTAKQREQRLVRLTLNEMATLPDDASVYEGVGKMYVPQTMPFTSCIPSFLWLLSPIPRLILTVPGDRFVSLPVTALREKLDRQTHDLESEVDKLSQRLLYLETTHKNSREHIEQMLRSR